MIIFVGLMLAVVDGQPWQTEKMNGLCYQPIPKGVDPPSSGYLHDSDLFNTDFQALWGVHPDPQVVSRDDLRNISGSGVEMLHIYNWNPDPAQRDHSTFLSYALSFEPPLSLWIPVSNYLFTNQWDKRHQVLEMLVDSTKGADGKINEAVFGWLVANEYDLSPFIDISMVAEVIEILTELDPGTTRPFSIPVSTQAHYNGEADPGLGALVEIHDTLPSDIMQTRYVHSMNPFIPFDTLIELIFEPYADKFESWGETPPPLQFTEIGRSEADVGHQQQFKQLVDLACGFEYMQNVPELNPYNFVTYFFFDFTREDWKGKAEELYGLNELGEDISDPNHPAETVIVAPGMDTVAKYEVNELLPIDAWKNVIDVQVNGVTSSSCDDFNKRHPSYVLAAGVTSHATSSPTTASTSEPIESEEPTEQPVAAVPSPELPPLATRTPEPSGSLEPNPAPAPDPSATPTESPGKEVFDGDSFVLDPCKPNELQFYWISLKQGEILNVTLFGGTGTSSLEACSEDKSQCITSTGSGTEAFVIFVAPYDGNFHIFVTGGQNEGFDQVTMIIEVAQSGDLKSQEDSEKGGSKTALIFILFCVVLCLTLALAFAVYRHFKNRDIFAPAEISLTEQSLSYDASRSQVVTDYVSLPTEPYSQYKQ